MEADLRELTVRYDAYVAGYRGSDGRLPEMMQLKYEHTMKVVENARQIADGENFGEQARSTVLAAALLHDTGRYEQLLRYNTFKDSDSVDHAVFSHDIVKRSGWLVERRDREAILAAVLYHNRRDLPEGMDELTAIAAHTVRDADKLDIFRVLEDRVRNSDWRHDSRAFWNLQCGVAPNPLVVAAVREHRAVDYQDIKSLADFVLIQIGWMISGLHFATSRHLCSVRGHLEFRRAFLDEIGGGAAGRELCDLVRLDFSAEK